MIIQEKDQEKIHRLQTGGKTRKMEQDTHILLKGTIINTAQSENTSSLDSILSES